MIPDWLVAVNTFAWISANLTIVYIATVLVVFVFAYYILFDPKATTAGKFIFRFFVSLLSIIGLIYISLFVDPVPGRSPFDYPGDVLWWRPIVRAIGYYYVAYTVTGLAVLLVVRKWFPEKLRTSKDRDIVQTRTQVAKRR